MRTPNVKCIVCGKPLYRRPNELARVRHVACMEHRNEAQARAGLTDAQLKALSLGRRPGTNNRTGYKHREESKRKSSESNKKWCAINPDKVKARGDKTRCENHYNWKGGSTRLNVAIRRMTEHRKWGIAVVLRDGKCVDCGAVTDLDAHHVKTFSSELLSEQGIKNRDDARECAALWDVSNGVTLCVTCHADRHGRIWTATGPGRFRKLPKLRTPTTGERNPNWRGGKAVMLCPQCGVRFEVKQAEVIKRKYCSRRCRYESQRKGV